jgi:hypothetical protein
LERTILIKISQQATGSLPGNAPECTRHEVGEGGVSVRRKNLDAGRWRVDPR